MLTLRATQLNWINGQADDPTDQCAHGKIELSVNNVTLYQTEDEEITVSAACLYLLRTVEDDHTPEFSVAEGNWLFPCCGFNLFPDQGRYKVCCMGCNTGTDVFVQHIGADVVLTRANATHKVTNVAWAAAVLELVEQVETFYASCRPKAEMDNDLDREGWALFWSEWESRKQRAARSVAKPLVQP